MQTLPSIVGSKQILVGLPSAGKTTFTAALWHVVESRELPDSLELADLELDTQYLHSIRTAWVACQTMERTLTGFQSPITMKLKRPQLQEAEQEIVTQLFFPDVDGERFRGQWERRECEQDYVNLVEEAVGLLLFIHPEHLDEPKTITEMDDILCASNGNAQTLTDVEVEEDEQEFNQWKPTMSPTQVQLVELLQFILHLRSKSSTTVSPLPLRVAVIISAWDVIEKTGIPGLKPERTSNHHIPAGWLTKHLPLLDQFLRANPERFLTKIFGISAQGGDVTQPEDVKQLQVKHKPSERIRVCCDDQETNDISDPIRWVMSDPGTMVG